MATSQQPLITLETFKGDFQVHRLISRLSDKILDQHEARVQTAAGSRVQARPRNTLPNDTVITLDQLLMQFERAERDLQELRRHLDDRIEGLSTQVEEAESAFQDEVVDFEEEVNTLSEQFALLDGKMTSVTSIATQFGDRLQATDAYRKNTEEAIRTIQAFHEFASAEKMRDLSDVFQNDSDLEEAAALTRKILYLATEVTRANERVSTQPVPMDGEGSRNTAQKGTIEYAKAQVEKYQAFLENKVITRFDKAEAKKDLTDMAACASIIDEFETSAGTSLLQRYILSRSMFTDPKELALGQSEPVVDTNTALAAKRRLGTMYKSILHGMRQEAGIMKTVFPRPQEAMTAFVQTVFDKRIQPVLKQMLTIPTTDASRDLLEAYLKLLSEAYSSTCNLSRTLQELLGEGTDVMELVEASFLEVVNAYPELEMRFLRLQYHYTPTNGPVGILLQDVVVQYCKWNQDAIERATNLLQNPAYRSEVIKRTVHNSSVKQEDFGCLLEQVAKYLVTGLRDALQLCLRRSGPSFGTASLPSMQRATVRQAALRVAEQGIGPVLGAISQAAIIIKTLQTHYMKVIAPALEESHQIAQACSKGFASMLRAVEDHIIDTLEAAITDFFVTAANILTTEQKRSDFRPQDDVPAPLDIPTEACSLVSALLAAVLQEASQTLQGSNLGSFNAEIGMRTHKLLFEHMKLFTFSSAGVLRWKHDVTEYCDALHLAVSTAKSVKEAFEDLKEAVNLLVVAPESLKALVDSSMHLSHAQVLQYVRLRDDYRTAKVKGKTLAAIFEGRN